MIDCHAHLSDAAFEEDLDTVLEQARSAGVRHVICVSEGPGDAAEVLALAESYPMLHACLGLHPDRADPAAARRVADLVRRHAADLVGIGEVGLDYWVAKEEAERERQRRVLESFVQLSLETDLPLNVHSRSAGRHVIALLRELGAERVLLHAFDGKARYALEAVELGYFLSIPPSILRSPQKQKLVRRLPLDALLLESDSPVLGPEPGRRNEPGNVALAAQAIAEIQGCPLERVVEVTRANARRLFGIDGSCAGGGGRDAHGTPNTPET